MEGLQLEGNRLSGPLFPAAWLAPGAMPRLQNVALRGNAALAGPLPDSLPWPRLSGLDVSGTAVAPGGIPAAWCSAPNAQNFEFL